VFLWRLVRKLLLKHV